MKGKIDPKKAKKFLEDYDKLCRKHGLRLCYDSDYEPYQITDGKSVLEIDENERGKQ